MDRRGFIVGAAAQAAAARAAPALANVPSAYDWSASPPRQSRDAFVEWMVKNRGEDPRFLGERFDRFRELIARHDVWDEADMRAYLLTPREEQVVALVAEGLGNRQIAIELNLSEHTIKKYLYRIFDKLGISTRVELVLYAVNHSQSRQAEWLAGA